MSDRPYFDPSDMVDIPDDAEPWENRPDAVADSNVPCVGCGGTNMPLHTDHMCPNCHELDDEVEAFGPEWYASRVPAALYALVIDDLAPWVLRRWGEDAAVLLAHQILSEVEARRGRTD